MVLPSGGDLNYRVSFSFCVFFSSSLYPDLPLLPCGVVGSAVSERVDKWMVGDLLHCIQLSKLSTLLAQCQIRYPRRSAYYTRLERRVFHRENRMTAERPLSPLPLSCCRSRTLVVYVVCKDVRLYTTLHTQDGSLANIWFGSLVAG